jgi:3-deoxy-D-manno-octulosonate 8-phosphate phosphatase (KDO 8-P phosphatase)
MIKLLMMDVDGVLTDGKIIYDENGVEYKNFNVKDGLGINLMKKAGIFVYIVSGRFSKVTIQRAKELGVDKVYQNVRDKLEIFEQIKKETGITNEQSAFVGDDINDLKLLQTVGFSAAVADAAEEIKSYVSVVLQHSGGNGAVREFVEKILKNNGIWEKITKQYY